jgi:hypothetical protein
MIERRAAPRHFLVLTIEMMEESSRAKASARTMDVSRSGCYVDTLNPFPVGMILRIRLTLEGETFESRARVVHQSPGMGMGIDFLDSDPEQLMILDRWLAAAPLAVS